jgi:hypothetical protein
MEKKSVYRFDRGPIYRPTRQEFQLNSLCCPKCKEQLFKPRVRLIKKVYVCKSCGWVIEIDKILSSQEAIAEHKKNRIIDNVISEVQVEPQVNSL